MRLRRRHVHESRQHLRQRDCRRTGHGKTTVGRRPRANQPPARRLPVQRRPSSLQRTQHRGVLRRRTERCLERRFVVVVYSSFIMHPSKSSKQGIVSSKKPVRLCVSIIAVDLCSAYLVKYLYHHHRHHTAFIVRLLQNNVRTWVQNNTKLQQKLTNGKTESIR